MVLEFEDRFLSFSSLEFNGSSNISSPVFFCRFTVRYSLFAGFVLKDFSFPFFAWLLQYVQLCVVALAVILD